MKYRQDPAADKRLIDQLDTDPDKAMETLLETYTCLVWHVASKYLSDPEDRKDCVSETFGEVYIYRKNQQIIRMEYDEGMSISEIAKTLQIPYETAKKRHTRSIRNLRKLLLLVLLTILLLVLVSCGIIRILQHFGFFPGYGITTEGTTGCYLLAEPVTLRQDSFTLQITDAALYGDRIEIDYQLSMPEEELIVQGYSPMGLPYYNALTSGEMLCDSDGNVINLVSLSTTSGGSSGNFERIASMTCVLDTETLNEIKQQEHPGLSLRLSGIRCNMKSYEDIELSFSLSPADAYPLENYACYYDEKTGGFMVTGDLNDGALLLDVYSLSNGLTECFVGLTYNTFDFLSVPDPVTIVDSAGTEYQGIFQGSPSSLIYSMNPEHAVYRFEGVTAGTYTLTLPYVYLLIYPEDLKHVTIDLENNTFRDETLAIPGGTLKVTDVRQVGTTDDWYEYAWEISVRCEMDDPDMTITGLSSDFIFPEKPAYRFRNIFQNNDNVNESFSLSTGVLDEETGTITFRFQCHEGILISRELDRTKLGLSQSAPISVLYDRPLTLTFEVTEP